MTTPIPTVIDVVADVPTASVTVDVVIGVPGLPGESVLPPVIDLGGPSDTTGA